MYKLCTSECLLAGISQCFTDIGHGFITPERDIWVFCSDEKTWQVTSHRSSCPEFLKVTSSFGCTTADSLKGAGCQKVLCTQSLNTRPLRGISNWSLKDDFSYWPLLSVSFLPPHSKTACIESVRVNTLPHMQRSCIHYPFEYCEPLNLPTFPDVQSWLQEARQLAQWITALCIIH